MSAETHAMALDHGDEPHVLPLRVYLSVWGVLMVLTVTTVAVAQFNFGSWNTVVAMVIATIKGHRSSPLDHGDFVFTDRDTRVNIGKDLADAMQGTGIALLFVGFAIAVRRREQRMTGPD